MRFTVLFFLSLNSGVASATDWVYDADKNGQSCSTICGDLGKTCTPDPMTNCHTDECITRISTEANVGCGSPNPTFVQADDNDKHWPAKSFSVGCIRNFIGGFFNLPTTTECGAVPPSTIARICCCGSDCPVTAVPASTGSPTQAPITSTMVPTTSPTQVPTLAPTKTERPSVFFPTDWIFDASQGAKSCTTICQDAKRQTCNAGPMTACNTQGCFEAVNTFAGVGCTSYAEGDNGPQHFPLISTGGLCSYNYASDISGIATMVDCDATPSQGSSVRVCCCGNDCPVSTSVSPTPGPTQAPAVPTAGPTQAPITSTFEPTTSPTQVPTLAPSESERPSVFFPTDWIFDASQGAKSCTTICQDAKRQTCNAGPMTECANQDCLITLTNNTDLTCTSFGEGDDANAFYPLLSAGGVCSHNFRNSISGIATMVDCDATPSQSTSVRICCCGNDCPVFNPTMSPTQSPTTPTSSPTSTPTRTPTSIPTASPTSIPTKSPTSIPTASPTKNPTSMPTTSPTSVPTNVPTVSPTASPTSSPTKTLSPTTDTRSPTASPTGFPTLVPSRSPGPTVSPTASPTRSPSDAPTNSPTVQPTLAPTTSPAPSTGTKSPTDAPSLVPTAAPTLSPTSSPVRGETITTPTGQPVTYTIPGLMTGDTVDLDPNTPGNQDSFTQDGVGVFTFDGNSGAITFVPAAGFTGTGTLDYTVQSASGGDPVPVFLGVEVTATAPVAPSDTSESCDSDSAFGAPV